VCVASTPTVTATPTVTPTITPTFTPQLVPVFSPGNRLGRLALIAALGVLSLWTYLRLRRT
jgi:hypothetical protein